MCFKFHFLNLAKSSLEYILASVFLIIAKKKPFCEEELSSALVGIRTPNLLIRSEMLYPIELQMHFLR